MWRRSRWPAKSKPNISQHSRSCQSPLRYSGTRESTRGSASSRSALSVMPWCRVVEYSRQNTWKRASPPARPVFHRPSSVRSAGACSPDGRDVAGGTAASASSPVSSPVSSPASADSATAGAATSSAAASGASGVDDNGLTSPALRHVLVLDALLEEHDAFEEGLRPGRAAGDVHVDGDDLVDALGNGVGVPVGPTAVRARTHRDHVLGVGHLLPEPADRG